MLILGATTQGISFPICSISLRCSGENPVVPTTTDFPLFTAALRVKILEAGVVKSIATSQVSKAFAGSSITTTPLLPIPATSPISLPMASPPARSVPPPNSTPSVSSMHPAMVFPIRPAIPITRILVKTFSPVPASRWHQFTITSKT